MQKYRPCFGLHYFFLFPLLFLSIAHVQSMAAQRTAALSFADSDSSMVRIMSVFSGSKNNNLALSVSLPPHCPVPEQQAQMNACAACGTGFGALTISQTAALNLTDTAQIQSLSYSAAFIHNLSIQNAPLPTSSGSTICIKSCDTALNLPSVLRFIQEKGSCLANTFPNNAWALVMPFMFVHLHLQICITLKKV